MDAGVNIVQEGIAAKNAVDDPTASNIAIAAAISTAIIFGVAYKATKSKNPKNVAPNAGATPNKTIVDKIGSKEFQEKVAAIESTDCSDLASILFRANKGKRQVIEFTPPKGKDLVMPEAGQTAAYKYHEVFVENGLVYDPRFSTTPVPLSEYTASLNKLNPGGFSTRIVEGQ